MPKGYRNLGYQPLGLSVAWSKDLLIRPDNMCPGMNPDVRNETPWPKSEVYLG